MAPHSISRLYVGALFTWLILYFLSLAIQYTDSDLWYHLAGGRHFLETGDLYNPLVTSFLEESRHFTNYFWGFQASVYITWLLTGETGLIVVKTALFVISSFFVLKVLLEDRNISDARFLHLFIFALIVGLLCARGLTLRPHLASYAMIPLFVYILAFREKQYFLLPVFTVIWVNLHGIEYVVGALICGSYFLSRLLNFNGDIKPLLWISLCLPATLLSPNGPWLWLTPLIIDPDLHLFIAELRPWRPEIRLDLKSGVSSGLLAFILLGLILASAVIAVRHFRANLAPLLMALGALILLLTASRFIWEWALLSTPLLAVGARSWHRDHYSWLDIVTMTATLYLLMATYWPSQRHGLQHYPFDRESLPYGTTAFIQELGLSGRYAIEPSYAGYIEFELPSVQVHLDMQFPPFTSLDIHDFNNAMRSGDGLRTYVERYAPHMLGVKKSMKSFPVKTAYELGYVPVFFDRKVVLFIDKEQFPQVATNFQLSVINPFSELVLPAGQLVPGIIELERMLSVVDTDDLKLTLVGLLIEQGDIDRAGNYLTELQQSSPDNLGTIYYQARFAHRSGNCGAAGPLYEKVLRYASWNAATYLQAAECAFLTADHRTAFRYYSEGLNPYKDDNPVPLIYFQYALSAVGAGEPKVAIRLLNMIDRFAPDSELQPQISKMLEDLQGDGT